MKATLTALSLALALPLTAAADDDLTIDKVPPPVAQAIRAALQDAQIDDIETVTLDGRTLYIAEAERGGRDITVHVTDRGQLIRRDEDIKLDEAPAPVRERAKAFAGRVDDIDRVTEGDTIRYEIEIDRDGAPDLDVVIDATGKVLSEKAELDD